MAELNDSSGFWTRGRSLEGIHEYFHKNNGLRAYISPSDNKNGVCSFNVAYDVGSRFEQAHEKGNAHFLEHATFQGTKTWDFMSSGAQINAMTQTDLTNFYGTLPSDKMHAYAANEAERMTLNKFSEEQVEKERSVVDGERQLGENNAMQLVYSAMMRAALGADTTIGRTEDFTAATAETLNAFWKKHYTTDRAAIFVCGDLPSFESSGSPLKTTLDVIHKEFGGIEKRSEDFVEPEGLARQYGAKSVMVDCLSTPANIVALGFRAPSANKRDCAVLNVISKMFGKHDRAKELIKKGLFYDIGAQNSEFRTDNLFMITGGMGAVDPRAQNVGMNCMLALVESFKQLKPNAEEINRAKLELHRDYDMRGLSNTETMLKINSSFQKTFNAFHGIETKALIDGITADDVQRVANTYFNKKNMTMVRYFPSDHGSGEVQLKPDDRSIHELFEQQHSVAMAPTLDHVAMAHKKHGHCKMLRSGASYSTNISNDSYNKKALSVQHVEKMHDINTHAIISALGAGVDTQQAHPDVVAMTSAMLMKGVKIGDREIDEDKLQETLTDKRIDLQMSASHGTFDIHLKSPQENTNVAFGVASALLNSPLLPKDEFVKMQRRKIAEAHGNACNVNAVANALLFNHMYPEGHPMHKELLEGADKRIAAVEYADVVAFHKLLSNAPRVATVFSPSGAQKASAAVLAPLRCASALSFSAAAGSAEMPTAAVLSKVVPDKTSVSFMMGTPVDLHSTHEDFLPLTMAINALAGGFGTRLMDQVRDTLGLTYGIGGGLSGGVKRVANSAAFVIQSSCKPSNLEKLQNATVNEVNDFIEKGIHDYELEEQKDYAVGSRKVRNDTPANELALLHRNLLDGNDASRLDSFEARVNAVTLPKINAVIKKYLKKENFSIVRVGSLE